MRERVSVCAGLAVAAAVWCVTPALAAEPNFVHLFVHERAPASDPDRVGVDCDPGPCPPGTVVSLERDGQVVASAPADQGILAPAHAGDTVRATIGGADRAVQTYEGPATVNDPCGAARHGERTFGGTYRGYFLVFVSGEPVNYEGGWQTYVATMDRPLLVDDVFELRWWKYGDKQTITSVWSQPACPAGTVLPDAPAPRPTKATSGPDILDGTPADDQICGLGGSDVIRGFAGNDALYGGVCPDIATAAAVTDGNDRIHGGAGKDLLWGGFGRDALTGGAGRDRLSGGPGSDRLSGGPGSDRLWGGRGRNVYSGGAGSDRVESRNGMRERIDCGSGRRDFARVDRRDRVRRCERVRRA